MITKSNHAVIYTMNDAGTLFAVGPFYGFDCDTYTGPLMALEEARRLARDLNDKANRRR